MLTNQTKIAHTVIIFLLLLFDAGLSQPPFRDNNKTLFHIEAISVEGNSKSRASVVFENLSIKVGDSLTEEAINNKIDDLRKLDLFKEVHLQPRAGSSPGKLRLIIRVKERYWPVFRFKGGFSELDSWYITPLALHFDNIFGFGNFTNLDLTFGDRIFSIKLNHKTPNIFNSDFDFHSRVYVHSREFIHYLNNSKLKQKVPQGGFFVGLQSRQGLFRHLLLGLDFYSTTPDSFATYASSDKKFYSFPENIARDIQGKENTSAFSAYYNLDLRDNTFYPSAGWWLGMWFTQADEQLGGKINFTRFIFDIRKYQHIYEKLVIAARLKAGFISPSAPFYEKFYLGGPNSLRGYADRSISPAGGGDKIYQTGLEIRYPISHKNFPNHFITGVLFMDAGSNLQKNQAPGKVKGSYGFGFRFRLPFFGLFRMDLAYPFKGEKMIQFSLGHTF